MAPTAPPIDGQTWINHPGLTADQLRGRVVVLVFWAASCEASLRQIQRIQNVLAEIKASNDDPADPDVVAVAVHSPRMPIDDDVERVEHMMARHRVTIPVVHDPRFETWNRYEPQGWPSTAVVDRNGRVTGISAGCHDVNVVAAAIETALASPLRRRRKKDHRREPIAEAGPVAMTDAGPNLLRYPEGIAVGPTGHSPTDAAAKVAIADTGNDRILVGNIGPVMEMFAVQTEIAGLTQPTSVAFVDANNIAVVERGANVVSNIEISTGRRTLVTAAMVRPTAVTVDKDGSLIICDGGGDRIYRAKANSTNTGYMVLPIAGSGIVGASAGNAAQATLAQPSAAIRANIGIVFTDAASSNVRILSDGGEVVNVTDSNLFDWGLVDGLAHRARLMRPSGLAVLGDGSVLIVDSGNDRLRRLQQRQLSTVGLRGLSSPTAAATVDGHAVIVVDTNNHRLVAIDVDSQIARIPSIELATGRAERSRQVSSGSAVAAT